VDLSQANLQIVIQLLLPQREWDCPPQFQQSWAEPKVSSGTEIIQTKQFNVRALESATNGGIALPARAAVDLRSTSVCPGARFVF
jgi:hypothetical protein